MLELASRFTAHDTECLFSSRMLVYDVEGFS